MFGPTGARVSHILCIGLMLIIPLHPIIYLVCGINGDGDDDDDDDDGDDDDDKDNNDMLVDLGAGDANNQPVS